VKVLPPVASSLAERRAPLRTLAESALARHHAAVAHVLVDGGPQGLPGVGRRLAQPLHLLLVGAQREAEHVGDHLLAQPLALELLDWIEKDAVGDV
jgi:hypothetical protein